MTCSLPIWNSTDSKTAKHWLDHNEERAAWSGQHQSQRPGEDCDKFGTNPWQARCLISTHCCVSIQRQFISQNQDYLSFYPCKGIPPYSLCLSGFAFKAAQFVKNERSRTGGAFNHIWQECKWTTIQADWTHDTTSNHNPGTLVKINLKGSTKSKVCDISLCHRDEVPCCSCGSHRCWGSRHQWHRRQGRGKRTESPSQVKNSF